MKNAKVKRVLCGVLAVVMAITLLLEYPVSATELAKENTIEQVSEEEELLKKESAIAYVSEKEMEKEPLKGIAAQEESVLIGRQAAKLTEEKRQEDKKQEDGKEILKEEKEPLTTDDVLEPDGQLDRTVTQGIISGTCGENVNFQLDSETGEVIVSGSGKMADYEYATDSPFYPYGDIITSVQIEEGITSVGALAFAFCFGIEKADFPSTLTEIGNQAFLGCTSMETIIVPEQVASIGDYALGYYCKNGKEGIYAILGLNILGTSDSAADTYAKENNITFFALDTISHACGENLTWNLNLKTGVLEISGSGDMSDYERVSYNNALKPPYYSYRSYITSLVIKDGVTSIGKAAFCEFDKLKEVQIADSVTSIGSSAFSDCGNLESILLPKELTTIENGAFSNCYQLKEVMIPQKVEVIKEKVFSGCNQLERIEVEAENPFYMSKEGILWNKEQSTLVAFPKGYQETTYLMPDTLRTIAPYAISDINLKYLIFQGDIPSGFGTYYKQIDKITIFYNSANQGWDSMQQSFPNISWVDMSELLEKDTLSITAESQQLKIGESIQLSAEINPMLAVEFKWSSSDENVAVVSQSGKVIAVNSGATKIQVSSQDGTYIAEMSVTVTGDTFSMPSYDLQNLEGQLNYTSVFVPTKQIASEKLHGIYFLNGKELGFYSLIKKDYQVVETFPGCDDAYVAKEKLYLLYNNTCYIYDLTTQFMLSKFYVAGYEISAIGADDTGNIYLGGFDKYHSKRKVILLFSEDGEKIYELPMGIDVYAFSGFDSTNGYFYMETYYDFYAWGYSHPGKGLTMGKKEGNKLKYIDTYNAFLESGLISRSMSCLMYLCQDVYMYHQTCAELLGGKYLTATSAMQGIISVYDSHSINNNGINRIMNLNRAAAEEEAEEGYDDFSSIGVRAVYNEKNDSVILYENNKTISEYSLSTKEKIASYQTKYKVFNMLKIDDSVVAIEKDNNAYYMEILDWGAASQMKIQAENETMKVGTYQTLSLELDKTYTLFPKWSSSDNSIASVTQGGKVAAWKEGTVTITAKVTDSLSATINITVTAGNNILPEKNIVKENGTNSSNDSANNYERYGKVVNSYLVENDDKTLTRVEYIPDKGILVENYSSQYKLQSSKVLKCELELFGGFYSGKDANFFVFGQKNEKESDETEVLRIVKYNKNWERLGHASVKGANTYIPFDAGSLRMDETDGKLYIHTCHEMYAKGDGYHHQANMTFVLNEKTMEMEQSYYDTLNLAQAGYVSHSFNQFVQTDGNYAFRVDHGDAYPRAIVLTRCEVDGKITDISYCLPFSINGDIGNNSTGVSIGGLELSSDNCLIVGNSVDQSDKYNYSAYGQRNIFLTVTDKQLNNNNIIWLTDYKKDSDITPYTPTIVKLNEEQFLIMWEEYHSKSNQTTVKMVTVNAEGTQTSEIKNTGLMLSDCVPICTSDGLVKWYVTDQNAINFYMINPYQLSSVMDPTTEISVTNIKLNKTNISINKGESVKLTATLEPTEVSGAEPDWLSSNPEVATVEKGKVTAKTVGTAIITAKIGKVEATCKVTVKNPTTRITLNKTKINLVKGKSITIKATITPKDSTDKVVWSTSDKKIATVENGKISAKGAGTATITTKAGNKEATCKVTVKIPATKITLNKTKINLVKGRSITIKAAITPKDSTDKVVWSTSDKKVATVKNGKISAKQAGTATITAKAGSKKATCKVTVKVPATKITLNTTQIYLLKGKNVTVKATITPKNSTDKVVWSTSSKKIATVKNGKISAKKTGTATITAKAGSKKKTVKVHVVSKKKKAKKVTLNKKSVTIKKGETLTLKATVTPKQSTDFLTWSSSNKKIVKVDKYGQVTALKKGKTKITVKTSSGKKASCSITVK